MLVATFLFSIFLSSTSGAHIRVTDPSVGVQIAISAASTADTIEIGPGTYTGPKNCPLIINGTMNLSLLGSGTDRTIIDCQHMTRCLLVDNAGTIRISGVSFKNGQAPVTPFGVATFAVRKKGGPRSLPASRKKWKRYKMVVEIEIDEDGNIISERFQKRRKRKQRSRRGLKLRDFGTFAPETSVGGCICFFNTDVVLDNIRVTGGRALFGAGLGARASNFTITNSVFTENEMYATHATIAGGGLFVYLSDLVTIFNTTVSENVLSTAGFSYGAGLAIHVVSYVIIEDSLIDGNLLLHGELCAGAGIYFDTLVLWLVSIIMRRTTISNNHITSSSPQASLNGGGMQAISIQQLQFHDVTIIKNSIQCQFCRYIAGAAFFYIPRTETPSPAIFTDCDFSDNRVLMRDASMPYPTAGVVNIQDFNILFLTRITIRRNAVVVKDSDRAEVLGGGLYLGTGMRVEIRDMFVTDNSIQILNSSGDASGGGGYINAYQKMSFSGGAVTNNTIFSSSVGHISGAGLSLSQMTSADVTIEDTFISHNLLVGRPYPVHQQGNAYKTLEKKSDGRGTRLCAPLITITNNWGTFSDGSLEYYEPETQCAWLIQSSNANDIAYGTYQLTFLRLEIESAIGCTADALTIYDGITTNAPLVGKICGSLQSPVCIGQCPALNASFTLTSAQFLTIFSSDEGAGKYDGFALQWTLVPKIGRRGGAAGFVPALSDVTLFGAGGGLALESVKVTVRRVTLQGNSVDHPLIAFGGAIAVFSSSNAIFIDTHFVDNHVTAQISGGGGVAATGTGTEVNFIGCSLRQNSLTVTGLCMKLLDDVVRCGVGFGGAVLAVGSAVDVKRSLLEENFSNCESSYYCQLNGVAIGVSGTASIGIAECEVSKNELSCNFEDSTCFYGAGSLFAASGVLTISNSTFIDNALLGQAGGGAVYAAGSSNLQIFSSVFANNSARAAGGIWATGTSVVSIFDSEISRNVGDSVAGAIVVTGDSELSLVRTFLRRNNAARVSALVAYNDNRLAKYNLVSTTIISDLGLAALMLGSNTMSDVLWNCTHPGSVFVRDNTSEYYSIQFVRCEAGTYTIDAGSSLLSDRTCVPCPFGASCVGSSPTSNGLLALTDYWGVANSSGIVNFYICPAGYCCGDSVGCPFNFCAQSRVGPLCGRCGPGRGLWFFAGEKCGLDSECTGTSWVLFLAGVGAVAVAIFLLVSTGEQTSGNFSVVLFFYQVLPLVKSSPWKAVSTSALSSLVSIFSMSPSSTGDISSGVCVAPSMLPSDKLAARIYFQGAIAFAFLAIFLSHYFISRFFFGFSDGGAGEGDETRQTIRSVALSFLRRLTRPPTMSLYGAAFVRFLTIAYVTMVLVPLQMIQCVYIEERFVWWYDANVACYEELWQKSAIAAASLLAPLPVLCIYLMKRWHSADGFSEWRICIRNVLSGSYTHKSRWYLGVSLMRRLLFAVVFTTITDRNWRCVLTMILCLLFLSLHIRLSPFKSPTVQIAETVSLAILGVLSASTAPILAQIEFGSSKPVEMEETVEYIQMGLSLVPAIIFLIGLAASIVSTHFTVREAGMEKRNDVELIHGRDEERVCVRCHQIEEWDELEMQFC